MTIVNLIFSSVRVGSLGLDEFPQAVLQEVLDGFAASAARGPSGDGLVQA